MGLGLYITYRVMFINGGNHAIYQTTDCVLHGIRQGCTMVAAHLADSLFIWRLYVIWSRNIRILVLPAFLFICSATGATVVTITDFLLGNGQPYVAINSIAFDFILAVVIANTCYVTILLAGRLWWVGRMTDKMESPGQIRKSRYQGAIIALVQSGFMYTVAVTLSLIFEVKQNIAMGIVMGNVTAAVVGISATLLVLVCYDT
ncbi:hypothetical protein FRB96_009054 [Tulasnella sp. 330]|nr:hypothetical protein FRB96_009054 [Tulasnella sp. 330]